MKKLLKKKLSCLLVSVMLITVIPFTNVKAETDIANDTAYTDSAGNTLYKDTYGNTWKYTPDNNTALGTDGTTYQVGPATPTSVSGAAIVPSSIGGKTVTSISGDNSGWYSKLITSLTIPSSITYISSMAFTGWANLQSVNFDSGSNLKVIQRYAFGSCSSLTSITLPASVQEIGVLYTHPSKETGYDIFSDCNSLMDIQVEGGNTCFKSVDGVLYNYDGTILYAYPANKSGTSYEIPATVTTINSCAFNNNKNLTSISFASGSNLTTLGDRAFGHASKIASFSSFPTTLVNFGSWVFGDTAWLKNQITTASPYLIINNVLLNAYYCLDVPNSVILPDGITTINNQVFSNATFAGDTNVTIPASVITIGKNAFYDGNNLKNIIFATDSNLETIGESAFWGCTSISSIKLPDKVNSISSMAFAYMTGLKSIAIPDSVTTIYNQIFYNDTPLEYIYTDNATITSAELHESWNTFTYSFKPFASYGLEALSGAVAVSGPANNGATLTAVTSFITNSDPGTYSYAWYRVDAATNVEVPGVIGTTSTYTVTTADIGYYIKLKVSSSNCSGTLTATTGIIPKVDCPAANVPVSGSVNNAGTNKTFTFTGIAGVTYEYSLDNGSTWNDVTALTGTAGLSATGTISLGNVAIAAGGLKVRAKETTLNNASASITNDTAYTASLEGSVNITGITKYNETLTANASGYQTNAALIFTWYRSGSSAPIKTGSSNEYTISAADIGKTISVKVLANAYSGNLEASTVATIDKADAVITIAAGKDSYSKSYGDADFYLEGITNNVNQTVTYTSSKPDGLTVTSEGKVHINAATDTEYKVTVALPGTVSYNAAASKSVIIKVGKTKSVSLSLSNLSQTSNNIKAPTVTMVPYSKTAFDKIKVEYGVVTGSAIIWSGTLPTTVGNYKVRATLTKDNANSDSNLNVSTSEISTGILDFVITAYAAPSNDSSTGDTNSGNPAGTTNTSGAIKNEIKTNPDGSTTQTSTVVNSDGSTTSKSTTKNADGSNTVKESTSTTITNKDGSTKTVEATKETITAADGTTTTVTTNATTSKEADGSSTTKSTISTDANATTATMTVKTDADGNVASATAVITAGDAKVTISNKTAKVSVPISQDILDAVAVSDSNTEVTIKITSDTTKATLEDSKTKSVTVAINIPSTENVTVDNVYLSKDVASTAAKNKKDLKIVIANESGDDYTVKIAANDLGSVSKDLNLSLTMLSYKDAAADNAKLGSTIKSVLKSSSTEVKEIQVVCFSDDKSLKTDVTITYDVSSIKGVEAGDKVYVYRYNSKTSMLEEVKNNAVKVSKNGTITISTDNGGNFVVSANKLTGKKITTLDN